MICAALLLGALDALAAPRHAGKAEPTEEAAATAPAPVSSAAQQLYAVAKHDLLQIRTLLKNGQTQASIGSGFLVGTSDLVVTNYHVMSQIALEPDVYVGEFIDADGQCGSVELLAVDVLHDLAVVRVSRKGTGFFQVPARIAELAPLSQGQYLYSLGNPLDLGFTISEGAYNGVIGRSFYDQYMFTGAINAGMSGGPNVNANGRLAGVNVAKRLDGELVSFLVPAKYVVELLQSVQTQLATTKENQAVPSAEHGQGQVRGQGVKQKDHPASKDFSAEVARQLIMHQSLMVKKLLDEPFTQKKLGHYAVPVRESDQMRCWGRSNVRPEVPFTVEQLNCQMESALYVSDQLQTGHISIQHRYTRSKDLGALRFNHLSSNSFKNRLASSGKDPRLTAPSCHEAFVDNQSLNLRAVLCVRAYRKFAGLYDFSLMTISTDQNLMNLQSRIDTRGVSFENGQKVSRLFLESISKVGAP